MPAYDNSADNSDFVELEVRRLDVQDKWLTDATSRFLKVTQGTKVVDIGAGTARGVQGHVEDCGGTYTAIERNKRFVDERRQSSGGAVREGNASELRGVALDGEFDLAVSRAVLAWVADSQERKSAIAEHFRVAENVVIINFDWSTISGGPAANLVAKGMRAGLEKRGFIADYGSVQDGEVRKLLSDRGMEGNYEVVTEIVTGVDQVGDRAALEIAKQAVGGDRDLPFFARLSLMALVAIAVKELRWKEFRRPDIVVTTATVRGPDRSESLRW